MSTDVALFVTTCLGLGPRTDAAGFRGSTWWTTSQSQSARMAAKCCFTVGADPGGHASPSGASVGRVLAPVAECRRRIRSGTAAIL